MHVLSHNWSDLLRGNQSAILLNAQLHLEWDEKLDALSHKVQLLYKRQYKNWQTADRAGQEKEGEKDQLFKSIHAEWQERTEPLRKAYQQEIMSWQKEINGKRFWAIAFLVLALLGLPVTLVLTLFEPLFCLGIIVPIGFGVVWLFFHKKIGELEKLKPETINLEIEPQRERPEPRPMKPSKPDLVKPDFDLVKEWWNHIEAEHTPDRKLGDEGERALLQALEDRLPDEFVAVRQVMIARNIDLDVLVLGPNGIWILESKFWTGTVSCHDGVWQRKKDYYGTGGYVSTKEDLNISPFDEEWLYEEEAIRNFLCNGTQGVFFAQLLKGGLVFTHPDIQLDIDSSCKTEFGKTNEWVEKIISDPVVPDFTMKNILNVADRLMVFSAPLKGIKPSAAIPIAETLYSDNNQRLEEYGNYLASLLV